MVLSSLRQTMIIYWLTRPFNRPPQRHQTELRSG